MMWLYRVCTLIVFWEYERVISVLQGEVRVCELIIRCDYKGSVRGCM